MEQAKVLAEADLVVCHGGSGTVFGALAAGVPVVVVPLFADQFENGRRIAVRGAGVVIEPEPRTAGGHRRVIGDGDVPRIVDAINTVLGTAFYRRNAGHVALEMAAAPMIDEVLEALLAEHIDYRQ